MKSIWTFLLLLSVSKVGVLGNNLRDQTLKIGTILNDPFLTKTVDDPTLGNEQYEGFVKDLLDEIASVGLFSYTLHLSRDGRYGALVDGKWDGMMGMVQDGTVDLAAADLTVTHDRLEHLDFSQPFIISRLTILLRRVQPTSSVMSSWLRPFSGVTWLLLLVSYLATGIGYVYNSGLAKQDIGGGGI